jgi:hypothetical protein
MPDFPLNQEHENRSLKIGYDAMSQAKEKIFAENQLLQQRISFLEDRLINKYNDPETVKSDFTSPTTFAEYIKRFPGVSHITLQSEWEELVRREEEIKRLNKELNNL